MAAVRHHKFQVSSKSDEPFSRCGGGVENCHFLYLRPVAYNSLYYRTSRDMRKSISLRSVGCIYSMQSASRTALWLYADIAMNEDDDAGSTSHRLV